MLTTREVADLLDAAGIKSDPKGVAELAREGLFEDAFKDEKSNIWQIPPESVASYIKYRRQQRRKGCAKWLTAGVILTLIPLLGLILVLPSALKDTADFVVAYILPGPTATMTPLPTSTPSLPRCKVIGDRGAYLFPSPNTSVDKSTLPVLPSGTEMEVVGLVPGLFNFYQIASYRFDGGPIVITEILPDSPAKLSGLRVGDVLLQADHVSLHDPNEMRKYIRENAGRRVILVVKRNEREESLSVVPRVSPPYGEGPIGFAYEGGIIQGDGGYVATTLVSCTDQ